MKKLFILMLCLAGLLLMGCGGEKKSGGEKLKVVASIYPMADFAANVGGDLADIKLMVPDGVEPHDWEPSARDLGEMGSASIFIYNGTVETWAQKAIEAVGKDKILAVKAGAAFEDRADAASDPHYWTSPKKAMLQVDAIAAAFAAKDPSHKAKYEKNAAAYREKLAALDKELEELSKKASRREFVTTHAAFGNLAKDYGFEQIPIMGISPEAEPSPSELVKLVSVIREKKIRYVFFETLTSPKVAETIARETGAGTLVLNPLEGLTKKERDAGDDYVKVMQKNIASLKKALAEP